MNFHIITLFPDMFQSITDFGVTGRAFKQKKVSLTCWNPRDFTTDKHKTVDDRPYGGGPGMLMKVEPLQKAILSAKNKINQQVTTIYLSPQGERLTQKKIAELAKLDNLVLIAGRYEGVDERLIESEVDVEYSIGDYVLSGGEIPAMVVLDAIIRLLPGVLGDEYSAQLDSFQAGLLDYPQYTRPELLHGKAVPEVLLSGHHEQIEAWRMQQSLGKTWLKRPDLLKNLTLTEKQQKLLAEFQEMYVKHKGDRNE